MPGEDIKMVMEILDTVRQATTGDSDALQTLLDLLNDKKISATELEQIHIFLRKSAKESHHAIYVRALMYKHGYGVKMDPEMAFLSMREAAAKGNALAIYEVGRYFLDGFGVDRNYASAYQWLKTAADSPHYNSDAMRMLGRMHEEGMGFEMDMEQAQYWYGKANKS